MKTYWSIAGIKDSPLNIPCIAFRKEDGQNMRFGYSKKRGFYKFGSRYQMRDIKDKDFGPAIELFLNKYADGIEKVFGSRDLYKHDSFTVFAEYVGPNSFAGIHQQGDNMELFLFDVNIERKGFITPRHFVKLFGHLNICPVVYEGNFNKSFIEDVQEGRIQGLKEGVVAKGVLDGGKPQHSLWMTKVKTKAWLEELRKRAAENPDFMKTFKENMDEQIAP